jgi:hypothetical protein
VGPCMRLSFGDQGGAAVTQHQSPEPPRRISHPMPAQLLDTKVEEHFAESTRSQGRASSTMLNGVSVAFRT